MDPGARNPRAPFHHALKAAVTGTHAGKHRVPARILSKRPPYPNVTTRFAAVATFCAESTTSSIASRPRFRYLSAKP